VQQSTNLSVRGRVMALYILVQLGGQALGGPLMGWIVERVGPAAGMAVSGVVPFAAALVIAIVVMARGHLRLTLCRDGRVPSLRLVPTAADSAPTR
jgi:MFS family permease